MGKRVAAEIKVEKKENKKASVDRKIKRKRKKKTEMQRKDESQRRPWAFCSSSEGPRLLCCLSLLEVGGHVETPLQEQANSSITISANQSRGSSDGTQSQRK